MLDSESPPRVAAQVPLAVVGVMAAVLVLRLLQLSSSSLSPLTYQLGPDEDYYFRFARAVIDGRASSAEFGFMDPLYGYLLAGLFRLVGANVFVAFALQCLLDVGTAAALLLIGRELNRPRAGLIAAGCYGLTSTALMFACSLLKEVWVAAFMTWWVLLALRALRSPARWPWLAFGLYCGIGVALRSTALLLVGAGFLLPLLGVPRITRHWAPRAALFIAGVLLALLPWSLRNERADGTPTPLPHNSGVVLHQAYNADNPASQIWIPAFVNYLNPSEIWRGYAAEAERRAGHPLRAHEVDAYWKAQALGYISAHPTAVLAAIGTKALKFFASSDTPINRSLDEEALFSPPVRYLPAAAPWLIAFGLVGLASFARTDRRWLIVSVPVAVAFVTVALFWAEDRFRFHAMPLLALGAGLWGEQLLTAIRGRGLLSAVAAAGAGVLLLSGSFALGRSIAPTPLHWDQIIWGYIKMNRPREAEATAMRVVREQPDNGAVWEAVGYLAVLRQDFADAEQAYRRAVQLRPRSDLAHFDLAKVLERLGRLKEAREEASQALSLREDPDYRHLMEALKNPPVPET